MTADSQPKTAFLLPRLDDDSAAFWNYCAAGELRVQACGACGRRRMPPRPMCPACNSLDVRWEQLSGRGRVWSFVVTHPPLLDAYAAVAPYNVVVVEAEEDAGIRFVGNLVVDEHVPWAGVDPATIAIGEPVVVCFPPAVDGVVLPRWRRL